MMNNALNLKLEEELLLKCAQTCIDEKKSNEIRKLLQKDLDWDYIQKIATKHRLRPILYWNLNQVGPKYIPKNVYNRLYDFYQINAKKNLLMLGELIKILRLFQSNSLNGIPYKGPLLALREYGDLSLREFSDLDIFIQLEHVLKAKEILMGQGYVTDVKLEKTKEKKYIETQRDLKFINRKLGIILEIHWTFNNLYFSLPSFPKLYEESKASKILLVKNFEIVTPSNEDMFLILCLHNANHRWERLFWICDICEFVKSHDLDWSLVNEKAESLIIKKIVLINLYLANDLFGLNLPQEIVYNEDEIQFKRFFNRIKSHINELNSFSLIEEVIVTFNLREKTIYGIKDVFRGITTPGVCEWKNLSLPTFLYSLYIIYRPYNLIKRYWKRD